MSAQQIALIAAAALLLFWSLGAYNRLVALRNRIGAAFAQVDDALRRRAAALASLAEVTDGHDAEAAALLDAALSAQAPLRSAADALRSRPAQADRASALVEAEAPVAAAVAGLLARGEQPSERSTAEAPLAELSDAMQRLSFARQLFNDAVVDYNAAAAQFPTRWLTGLFRFGPAGGL